MLLERRPLPGVAGLVPLAHLQDVLEGREEGGVHLLGERYREHLEQGPQVLREKSRTPTFICIST